ncbi:hypothetical protein FSP39_013576 [Pinctada imbricata]|uniref:Uncharacterized protein n=1 Tax=Pinctada imbricata TaxID=66713 RepID=A0AA88YEJ3_PINIB|nr:hypothetical protein FSP39_013576 [Pinctada imbricata]
MDSVEYAHGLLNLQTVLVSTFFGLLTYYTYQRLKYRQPPGPWALPIIGNWKGPSRAVFLNSLEVVIEAMVKRKADFASRPMLNSFGELSQNFKGIIFSPYNAVWKFQKKVAGKALRSYLQGTQLDRMLNDVLEKVIDKMTQEKEPFVATDYMNKISIHMLFNMCFGRKCNLDDPEINRLLEIEEEIVEVFGNGFFEDVIPFMTRIYTTQSWKKMKSLNDEGVICIQKELKEHRDSFDRNNIRDFTDALLLAHLEALEEEKEEDMDALTDDQIMQIIYDVLYAGHDGIHCTLDWFISCMVAHPEIQKRCQEEIDRVVGQDREPSITDRPNLSITEACIMETMRVGTISGVGLPHETICDTTVGGYDIPKGTMVFINHWALHNDKAFWKNVDEFDPYRYLDQDGNLDSKPDNWLPFSAGRRICSGEAVAKAQFVLIVSNLLQKLTFKAPPGVHHKLDSRSGFTGNELPVEYKVIVEKRT